MVVSCFKMSTLMTVMMAGSGLLVPAIDAHVDDSVVAQELRDREAVLVAAYNGRDIPGLLDCFTDDLKVMPPGYDLISNKQDIKTFLHNDMNPKLNLTLTMNATMALCDDYAVTESMYTFCAGECDDDVAVSAGEFVQLWRNEKGVWMTQWGIWAPDDSK